MIQLGWLIMKLGRVEIYRPNQGTGILQSLVSGRRSATWVCAGFKLSFEHLTGITKVTQMKLVQLL